MKRLIIFGFLLFLTINSFGQEGTTHRPARGGDGVGIDYADTGQFIFYDTNKWDTTSVISYENGVLTLTGSLSFAGDILPSVTSTYDLGSYALRWDSLYVNYVTITNNATIGGSLTAGNTTLNGYLLFNDPGTNANSFITQWQADNATTVQTSSLQTIYGANPSFRLKAPNNSGIETTVVDFFDENIKTYTDFVPNITSSINVGHDSLRFDSSYIDDVVISNNLVLENGASSPYLFTQNASNSGVIALTNAESGASCGLHFFPNDGDGTDNSTFALYGMGTAADPSNSELLAIQYRGVDTNFVIRTVRSGTGLQKSIRLYASANENQLKLNTDGTTSFGDDIIFPDGGTNVNSDKIQMVADNAGTAQTGEINVNYGANPYIRMSAPNAAGTATPTMDMRSDLVSWFNGEAGIDYVFNFNGETNDGTITYMEDEDRFDFDNDVNIGGNIQQITGVTDDLKMPAQALQPVAGKPDFNTDSIAFAFDKNTDESIIAVAQLPHAWQEGTDITNHVHWIQHDTGTVVWQIDYKWTNIGGNEPSAFTQDTSISITQTYTAGAIHQMSVFPTTISGSGKTASSIIRIKLTRDANNVLDTYDHDALLTEMDFHILINKFGKDL